MAFLRTDQREKPRLRGRAAGRRARGWKGRGENSSSDSSSSAVLSAWLMSLERTADPSCWAWYWA